MDVRSVDVIIRRLDENDVEEFTRVRAEALRLEPHSFGSSYEEFEQNLSQMKDRLKAAPDSFVLGCFAPQLAGIVGFMRHNNLKNRHKGFIWGMYVTADHRGQGLGRRLIEEAIAQIRTIAGVEEVNLTVVTTKEAARNLYLSLGFTVYGVEPRALKVDGTYLDEELMSLVLTAR
jgi:ribosomal protein S18 acetylase RimI-like enzyme